MHKHQGHAAQSATPAFCYPSVSPNYAAWVSLKPKQKADTGPIPHLLCWLWFIDQARRIDATRHVTQCLPTVGSNNASNDAQATSDSSTGVKRPRHCTEYPACSKEHRTGLKECTVALHKEQGLKQGLTDTILTLCCKKAPTRPEP